MRPAHTREAWLLDAIHELRKTFAANETPLPDNLKVSCSFPSKQPRKRIGEHWSPAHDGEPHQVFISPTLAEGDVLHVLVHELVHAAHPAAKHRGQFKKTALALGLEGPMTATHAGSELSKRLNALAKKLGPYPHTKLSLDDSKKQTTRLLKAACAGCEAVIRLSAKVARNGLPWCSCGSDKKSLIVHRFALDVPLEDEEDDA